MSWRPDVALCAGCNVQPPTPCTEGPATCRDMLDAWGLGFERGREAERDAGEKRSACPAHIQGDPVMRALAALARVSWVLPPLDVSDDDRGDMLRSLVLDARVAHDHRTLAMRRLAWVAEYALAHLADLGPHGETSQTCGFNDCTQCALYIATTQLRREDIALANSLLDHRDNNRGRR